MNEFQILENAAGERRAIKHGFSWPAFLLNGYWVLFKGLWPQALVTWIAIVSLIPTFAFLLELNRFLAGPITIVLEIAGVWFLGSRGNAWLVRKLERKGFHVVSSVEAESPADALLATPPAGHAA